MKLILQKKDIEALATLGLTTLQAKVYLTLAMLEEANIITISKSTNIARQEIHRAINELHDRGLVEKKLGKPIRYKAVPAHEAVPHLLQLLEIKRIDSHKKGTYILERINRIKRKTKYQENETQFLLVSEKASLSRRIKKAIDASQKSIKIVTPSKKFLPALFDLHDNLTVALQKGLAVKWVINKRVDSNGTPAFLKDLSKSTYFRLRYIPQASLLTFGLYDDNTLIVASDPQLNYAESQALWTNAFPVVKLADNYFNSLWAQAENT